MAKTPRKKNFFKTPKKRLTRTPLPVRHKTPKKTLQTNKENSPKSINIIKKEQNNSKLINSLTESQTISELQKVLFELSQSENFIDNNLLKKFLGLEINQQEDKIFFEFNNTNFELPRTLKFYLVEDEKYEDSFYYELVEQQNVSLPEFLKVNITFKKKVVMRFIMEVFVAMTSSPKNKDSQ